MHSHSTEGAPRPGGAGDEQDFWLDSLSQASAYNDWVAARIIPHLSGTVVEVGCGVGNYTRMLAPHADRLIGFDLEPGYIDAARRATAELDNVELMCADVFDASIDGLADAVVMLDVLEHLERDVEVLRRLRGLLAPGGRIVLKVPAVPAIYNGMDRAIGHYRRYGRAQLRAALGQAGYGEIGIRAFNLPGIFGWWLNGSLLRRRIPPQSQIGGFDRIVPFIRFAERLLPPPLGLSLFAVAVNPG